MGVRRIYVAGLLIFGALMLGSFIILRHYTLSELLANLRDFIAAKTYDPLLLLLLPILLLPPLPLFMLYWYAFAGSRAELTNQPLVLHLSDGKQIQAENQQKIAHLQSLLKMPDNVKRSPADSSGELSKQPIKRAYPSLDAEALRLQ